MPAFPLTDSPVQISQSITQDALLQNTGESVVYLSNESAVSPASYGLRLTPRGTVTWPANRELWAVVATGESGMLSVLYNASGAAVSEVTADIPGTIDVRTTTPVLIQGGGEELYPLDGGSINPLEIVEVTISAPPSGLRYPGIRVEANNPTGPTAVEQLLLYQVYSAGGQNYSTTVCVPPSSPNAFSLGGPQKHTFTVPFDGDYPITVFIRNIGSTPTNYDLRVWGTTAAVTEPVTDFSRAFFDVLDNPRVPIALSTTETKSLYMPATFQPQWVSLYAGANANLGNTSMSFLQYDGTWPGLIDQPHIARTWNNVNASGQLVNRAAMEFPLLKTGRAQKFFCASAAANAGTVYFTFYH